MKRWPYYKVLQGYCAIATAATMMGRKCETLNVMEELWWQLAMVHERQQGRRIE